jgi:hypothetical protein
MCVIIYLLFLPIFKANREDAPKNAFIGTLTGVIILIGVLQPLFGFLEYFGIITKLQKEFPIGGAFGNPGPYTNFLTTLLPVTLFSAVFYKRGFHKYGGILASILILAILPLTQARTSWIAAAVALVFVGIYVPNIQKILKGFVRNKVAKIVTFASLTLIVALVVIALLSFKKESATGRVFVWKVSTAMIKDKPMFGVGYDKFAPIHNGYQADYFKANPGDTENGYLADCVNFAFNEYIQITCELGIIGLILFLTLLFFTAKSFLSKQGNPSSIMGMGIVLVILTSSLFSYPLHIVPVLFLFFIGVVLVSSNETENKLVLVSTPKMRLVLGIIGFLICIGWFSISIDRYKGEKDWFKAFQMVRRQEFDQAKAEYSRLANKMYYNPFFLFNYGAEYTVMGDYKKSIEVLNSVEDRLADSDFYIYLGTSYEGIGDVKKALYCFEKASNMMPVKYLPKYKLVLLNQQLGNDAEAIKMAKIILTTPIKVKSDFVNQIRVEMEQYLQEKRVPYSK